MNSDSPKPHTQKTDKAPYVYSPRLFFLFIFAPSIITLVLGVVMTGDELDKAFTLMALSFLMSLVAGAFCSGILMRSRKKLSSAKGFFTGLGYFIASTLGAGALSFGGCLIAISI